MTSPLNSQSLSIYYGSRWFLLLAKSFVLHRQAHPYRRLSATLMVSRSAPFTLEVDDGRTLSGYAALLAPGVRRRSIVALEADLAIFDLPIDTPHYAALAPLLAEQAVLSLPPAAFKPLKPALKQAAEEAVSSERIHALCEAVVVAACGRPPQPRKIDERIERAVALLNDTPLSEASLGRIAQQLHLSVSRLRQLFKLETGCTFTHYARWAAVWHAARLWQRGTPWTQVAIESGFCDLSHLDRAFNEVFGLNPSTVVDPARVRLVRCD